MAKTGIRGKFITFEGPEGSGKSTHSKMLCDYLKGKGYPVVYTREPGGTPAGERIRQLLLNPKSKISPFSEMLLYMANHAQVLEEVISPALSAGRVVICDRFLDATICYQGYGLGLDLGVIRGIGRLVTGSLKPDLTFLLDIETKEGLRRSKGKDRIEERSVTYHRKVRLGYKRLARESPKRIKVIPARRDIQVTQGLIRNIAEGFLNPK